MSEFDFKRAWSEVAEPAFMALPKEVRDLFWQVGQDTMDHAQDPETLDLPWPEDSSLREKFGDISAEILAPASAVVYYFGHWAYGPAARLVNGDGGYWRFSLLADQELSARLGIPRRAQMAKEPPLSWRIERGAIRGQILTPDNWQWVEVGPATPKVWAACQKVKIELPTGSTTGEYREACAKFRKAAHTKLSALRQKFWPGMGAIGNLDPFMVDRLPEGY